MLANVQQTTIRPVIEAGVAKGALVHLAITHIFPREINALLTFSRSCPSVLSCLKALRFE